MAAIVLDQLAALTNVQSYQQRAEQLLEVFAGRAPEYGRFVSTYALAVDLHLHPPAHVVIIGPQSDARTQALWGAALSAFRPGTLVAVYDPAFAKSTSHRRSPPPFRRVRPPIQDRGHTSAWARRARSRPASQRRWRPSSKPSNDAGLKEMAMIGKRRA
jgi:uncharacterized protein YyaL (SSP411 family)